MPTEFIHGIEFIRSAEGPRPVRTVESNVIGLVGTALKNKPEGDPAPINTPTLIRNRLEAAQKFGEDFGTIPPAIDGVFDQAGATLVVVNVFDPATHKTDVAAADYDLVGGKYTLASPDYPISAVVVKNEAGATTYTEGTDYEVDLFTGVVSRITGGGIASDTATVKIEYSQPNESDAALKTAVQGGATAVQYTGVHALLQSAATVKRRPRILIAPSYARLAAAGGAPDAVLPEMYAIANRLRAVIVTGGPTDNTAAVTFRTGIASERTYFVNTEAIISKDNVETREDASARVAGIIARTDADRGWWHSPSNKPMYGIVGTYPAVDFSLDDPGAQSNVLNSHQIACIVQHKGFRLWGNEGCGSDPDYKFINVVRTADILADSLQTSLIWAVDECTDKEYIDRVVQSVNAYIRWLMAPPRRALLGGACWIDPAKNTDAQIKDGNPTFSMDFTPCYPARRITVDMILTDNYIQTLFT